MKPSAMSPVLPTSSTGGVVPAVCPHRHALSSSSLPVTLSCLVTDTRDAPSTCPLQRWALGLVLRGAFVNKVV